MPYTLVNNKKLFRFEFELENGDFAILQYRWLKGNMVLMHTQVPRTTQRRGIGSELVKQVLDYVHNNNLKIIPYCPFVVKYLQTHPEYNDLVEK